MTLTPPKELRIGTAGIPFSTKPRNTGEGIKRINELGLKSMELEFVRSVNIKEDKAPIINQVAEKEDVTLTAHGSYFINLNGKQETVDASIKRIFDAAKIADMCGGFSVVYHAGYYTGQPKDEVYKTIRKNMKLLVEKLKQNNIKVWVRPETTGKPTQFGDLKETIDISQEVDQVLPCIDFAHLHARTNGKENTHAEFTKTLEAVEKNLGKKALKNMHIHISGIDYGEKGEKKHLIFKEADMNIKDLAKTWKDFNISGSVVVESPILEDDALIMKKLYDEA